MKNFLLAFFGVIFGFIVAFAGISVSLGLLGVSSPASSSSSSSMKSSDIQREYTVADHVDLAESPDDPETELTHSFSEQTPGSTQPSSQEMFAPFESDDPNLPREPIRANISESSAEMLPYVEDALEQYFSGNYILDVIGDQFYVYTWDDNVTASIESGDYTEESWNYLRDSIVYANTEISSIMKEYHYLTHFIIEFCDGPAMEKPYLIVCDGELDYDLILGWDPE